MRSFYINSGDDLFKRAEQILSRFTGCVRVRSINVNQDGWQDFRDPVPVILKGISFIEKSSFEYIDVYCSVEVPELELGETDDPYVSALTFARQPDGSFKEILNFKE